MNLHFFIYSNEANIELSLLLMPANYRVIEFIIFTEKIIYICSN